MSFMKFIKTWPILARFTPFKIILGQCQNIGTHCVLDLCSNDKSHSSLFAIFKTYSEDKTTNAIILVSISPSTIVHWVHIVAIVTLRSFQLTCWSCERWWKVTVLKTALISFTQQYHWNGKQNAVGPKSEDRVIMGLVVHRLRSQTDTRTKQLFKNFKLNLKQKPQLRSSYNCRHNMNDIIRGHNKRRKKQVHYNITWGEYRQGHSWLHKLVYASWRP